MEKESYSRVKQVEKEKEKKQREKSGRKGKGEEIKRKEWNKRKNSPLGNQKEERKKEIS